MNPLRFANIEDLPAIVEIYNSTVSSRIVTADTEPVSVESKLVWFHAHNNETRPLWILEENEIVVAWMSFQDFYGRPAYSGTAELSIYIREHNRGKGLGKSLLKYAIEQSPTLKINNILGFIFGHNEPSLELFYKFGFEEWACLPGVAILDAIPRDLIILGKKLP